jgi:uncharacterized membrane protein YoaK (UPF0700 family)
MTDPDRCDGEPSRLWLGLALSGVAGFVDAVGFLLLGGLFVAFMSGNTTRLGIDAFGGSAEALTAGIVLPAFIGGAFVGTLLREAAGRRLCLPVLLAVEAGLLAGAAALAGSGQPLATGGTLAFAMGLQNLARQQAAQAQMGTTFVTGTLVGLGGALAEMLLGRARFVVAVHAATWLALLTGILAGALAVNQLGPRSALGMPSAALLGLAGLAMLVDARRGR